MWNFLKNYGLLVLMAAGFVSVIVMILMLDVSPQALPQSPLRIEKVDGEVIDFTVEVAKTPEQISYGLMFRQELAPRHGMLFILPEVKEEHFWMQNTLISLDMVFIGEDGVIRHIHPMARPRDTTLISSRFPVKAVLEVNGGETQFLGVSTGDIIQHEALGNFKPQ